jgi:transposase InsO family protein
MGTDPLPRGWTRRVRSSVLHSISLATAVLTSTRARASSQDVHAELERAQHEIALLREELNLKDSRWIRLSPRRRPHYTPVQRMRILQLKAARNWSCEQAAEALMIDEQTLKSWLRRVDEGGEHALVRLAEPVNRVPDFVRYLVRQLKALCPTMGKVRIAQTLARAGLHLSVTTVGRVLHETSPAPDDFELPATVVCRRVTARSPGDLWHIDLTAVPTGAGFWIPWLPFALPQRWPFCWWVLVVVDHVSRAVLGLEIHREVPTAEEVQSSIDLIAHRCGRHPRHVITDKGSQFRAVSWRRYCRARGIRPRFGAVGRHGSIAIVERFIRAMKTECTSRILVPLIDQVIWHELALYAVWYNEHRPSQALGGCTPREVFEGLLPVTGRQRVEPRSGWPANGGANRVTVLTLVVGYLEGRDHLPVVELREAA